MLLGPQTGKEWYMSCSNVVLHIAQVVSRSSTAHDRHDFGDAGRVLYDFFWGEFADWYIEAAKARLYGQDPQAALQTRQVTQASCCIALTCLIALCTKSCWSWWLVGAGLCLVEPCHKCIRTTVYCPCAAMPLCNHLSCARR